MTSVDTAQCGPWLPEWSRDRPARRPEQTEPAEGTGETPTESMSCGLPPILSPSRRPLFLRLVGNGALQATLALGVPLLVLRNGASMQEMLAALTVITAASIGLRVVELVDAEKLGLDFVAETRMALFDALADGRASTSHGVAMSRIVNDLSALKNWVGLGLARSISSSLALFGCILAAAFISPSLAAAASIPVILVLAAGFLLSPTVKLRTGKVRSHRGKLANRLSKTVLAIAELREQPGRLARRRRNIGRCSDRLTAALIRRMRIVAALRALPDSLLPGVLLTAIAIRDDLPKEAFLAAILVAGLATAPLRQLLRAIEFRATFTIAKERLETSLAREREAQ